METYAASVFLVAIDLSRGLPEVPTGTNRLSSIEKSSCGARGCGETECVRHREMTHDDELHSLLGVKVAAIFRIDEPAIHD